MTNKTWIGAALFLFVLVASAIVGLQVFRGDGSEPALASGVLERAAQAQTELLASVRPNSTLHVVFTEYDPSKANLAPGPGVNPVNTQKEWWAYFDESGNIGGFRAETTDMDTAVLIRVVEWADGELVTSYSTQGETGSIPFTWSIDALRQQIINGTNISLNSVVAEADQPARAGELNGRAAYVIEEAKPYGTQRVFIDANDYRPVKVEIVERGTVANSTAMPVYEFLEGNQVPAPG